MTDLLKEKEVLRILNNLKDEEPIKIEGQHYVVAVDYLTFHNREIKITLFFPVIRDELSKDPTFCLVADGDNIGVMDLLETVGVWEFIRFLITKGEGNGENKEGKGED